MAWKLTIGGVTKTTQIEALKQTGITLPLNARATAHFTCKDGLLPNRYAEVIMYKQDGTTPLFGGVILDRNADSYRMSATPLYTSVQCGDYLTYADWCYTSLSYASPVTLKQVLTDLVNDHLTAYGITLDVGQVDGPTLAAFDFPTNIRVSDALRDLMARAPGYVVRVNASKVLRSFVLGTDSAPYALTDAAPHCRDLRWRDSPRVTANTVILLCGPSSGSFLYEGERTADGVETSWTFDVRGSTSPWTILVGGSFVDVTPVGGGGRFEWDEETFTLTVGTDPTPTIGTVIAVSYWVDYPFEVTATTGASPTITYATTAPNVLTYPPGQETADGLLEALDQEPKELTFVSLDHGWEPGQQLTVALTSRVTGTYYITQVSVHLKADEFWVYTVDATDSETFQGTVLDQWREITGGGSSSAVVSGGGGGSTVTVLSSPAYLGGARNVSVMPSPAAWTPVPNYLPFVAQASFTGRIRVQLFARSASIAATARLYDVTASAAVMTTSAVTSQTAVETTATGAITSGHTYRLEVLNGTAGESVFCIGVLESV